MKTAIVTDTNSGMAEKAVQALGIFVLPMPVIVEGKSYLEGVNLTHSQLYQAMKEGKTVASSQPSPGDLMDLWNRILESGYEELLYIPMSSGLSGSCDSAEKLSEEYGGRVLVADNHRISATLREAVLDAAYLASLGKSAAEIKEYLETSAFEASIYLSVDSLQYLKKSGRITASAAAIGSVLNVKPVLTIQGEKLDLTAKVRGRKLAEKRMIAALMEELATRFSRFSKEKLCIATAGTFESRSDAENWRTLVQSSFPDFSVSYEPLPCSIACHVGVDAAGLGITTRLERN